MNLACCARSICGCHDHDFNELTGGGRDEPVPAAGSALMKITLSNLLLFVVFAAQTSIAAPLDQKMQKQQLETLLKAVLPFGETMLTNHGEFFPYGGTMSIDEKITSVAGYTGDEHPKSVEVIKLLKDGYRRDGAAGKILACALVYDVRITPPGQTEKTDAIQVDLDHRDGMSVTMFYPYRIGPDKQVAFSPPFAQKGNEEIFPKK